MFEEAITGALFLSLALLGLSLTVGYIVLRVVQAKARKGREAEQRTRPKTSLERELQAELDAERDRAAARQKDEEPEPALEPPKKVQQEMESLRKKYLGDEK